MQQEIEALDAKTRADNEKMARDQLSRLPDGHEYFKGRSKTDVLRLGSDDLLDFVEFDLFIHRSPRVRELQSDIDTYTGRVAALNRELEALSRAMHVEAPLTAAYVDTIASAETNTPVGGIDGRLRANLIDGVALMKQTVFGQDHVIEPIIQTLRRTAAGLNDPNRPLGVFMIAGPPGVGKTFIGEQLAAQLFGSDAFCTRIDMENFKESHTVSQLIGAPPGYAGYGKTGTLIEAAQTMPFGVIVLDEIEKAHPEIRQALLKMIGSGQMRGLDGEEADFRNIIIVQTTNYAQDLWRDHPFETACTLLVERLRQDLAVFSPEYLDRHDAILCAGPLNADALTMIAGKQVRTLQTQANRRHPGIAIDIAPADLRRFVEEHCEGASGRRAKRLITEIVGDPLTDILLADGTARGTLAGRYDGDGRRFAFTFERDEGRPADTARARVPA
jgi:ATP-dependent Clp protease ATP-binding subunit ClpA